MILLKWIMLDRAVTINKLSSAAVASLNAGINTTIIEGSVSKRDIDAAMNVTSLEGSIGLPSTVSGSIGSQTIEGNIDKC